MFIGHHHPGIADKRRAGGDDGDPGQHLAGIVGNDTTDPAGLLSGGAGNTRRDPGDGGREHEPHEHAKQNL
jgi:hypothetical protein